VAETATGTPKHPVAGNVMAAEGGVITVTVAEAGAELHPFDVMVNAGANVPADG
jgi:hypothetical protein